MMGSASCLHLDETTQTKSPERKMFPVIDRLREFLRKFNERGARFHLIGTPRRKPRHDGPGLSTARWRTVWINSSDLPGASEAPTALGPIDAHSNRHNQNRNRPGHR